MNKFTQLIVIVLGMGIAACGRSTETEPQVSNNLEDLSPGHQLFNLYCSVCHQLDGQGVEGAYPPLVDSEWAQGDKGRLIRLVLNGMTGPLEIKGITYNNVMTPHKFLSDEEIAAVLTFVRQNFENDAEAVTRTEVARVRSATENQGVWRAEDLEQTTGIPE